MNHLQLRIDGDAYTLSLAGQVLARLDGGASALLAGAGPHLREADIEAAIERAEDWLMPSSKSWQALVLIVHDGPGRLRTHLADAAPLSPQQVELEFSRAVENIARGRALPCATIADLVLVRELVHHGALGQVVFA